MLPQPIKPGRWYYLLAALVLCAGVAVFVFVLLRGIGGITDKLTQMEAPGTSEMNFTETGTYTIFYEPETVFDGKVYSTGGNLRGLWCNVVSKETGTPAPIGQPTARTTYTVGNRSGVSLLQFEIDRPGRYQVSAIYRDNPEGQRVILAIGHGVARTITTTVIIGLAVMFGTVILAALIAIITFVKRRRARKAFVPPSYPMSPPPYPGR